MTAKQESLNKLQLIQNVVCRTFLLADNYSSVTDMHKQLHLQFLDDRHQYNFVNLCHKNILVYKELLVTVTTSFNDAERTEVFLHVLMSMIC